MILMGFLLNNQDYSGHHTNSIGSAAIEECERNIRNMILSAPVAKDILGGNEYLFDIANQKKMMKLWRHSNDVFTGKPIFECLIKVWKIHSK
jgi:hypothetical protein